MKRALAIASCLIAVLALPAASAQKLYKSVMPDGSVVYSDKPPPGAAKVEERGVETKKAGVLPPSKGEKAVLNQMTKERQAREMASERLRKAEIALHDAEVAQQMGKEPQPNERLGTASGAQRLTDAYWQRQKTLEDNVAKAKQNLDAVRSGR